MAEIVWTDVRSAVPQAVRAENGVSGTRTVEARLTVNVEAAKPYRVHFTLRDSGVLVREWINGYEARAVPSAHRAYDGARNMANLWLAGWPEAKCRPQWRGTR